MQTLEHITKQFAIAQENDDLHIVAIVPTSREACAIERACGCELSEVTAARFAEVCREALRGRGNA